MRGSTPVTERWANAQGPCGQLLKIGRTFTPACASPLVAVSVTSGGPSCTFVIAGGAEVHCLDRCDDPVGRRRTNACSSGRRRRRRRIGAGEADDRRLQVRKPSPRGSPRLPRRRRTAARLRGPPRRGRSCAPSQDRRFVERLQRAQVDHLGRDALLCERVRGRRRRCCTVFAYEISVTSCPSRTHAALPIGTTSSPSGTSPGV